MAGDPEPDARRSVHVRLLGPIGVEIDGCERAITARRQRAVLAQLAIDAGRPVSPQRLLDAVWGDEQPSTGGRAVAFQISKLRTLLEPDRQGEGSAIRTSSAGYLLDVDRERIDVHRFDRLLDESRRLLSVDAGRSGRLVEEALALWRGAPFADLGHEPFVETEIRRLERRRLLAKRTLAEARVGAGDHVDAIDDLEALVVEHPLEEALVGLLMVALHRSGRTTDALRAYGELRIRLGRELGIEPSGELRQLEEQLLVGRSDVATSPGTDPGTSAAGTDRSTARSSDGGRTASAGRRQAGRVPASLLPFVGRSAEIEGVTRALASARLVTLSGFGGLGKTRLAQEVAITLADRFADGVWYVDLTPIADARLLADTVSTAGGVAMAVDGDPLDHLLANLADQEVLLVLDNCEQLLDDIPELVSAITRSAPRVRILATSRQRLGVTGEAVWPVPALAGSTAVELFVQRASLVRSGFVVDDHNRRDVERLCGHLDGIPLAIEMAAARLSAMGVGQIADHLDDRSLILRRTEVDADGRQESMTTVLDWSLDLLDPLDRQLLARLSVCVGGFSLEAACSIGAPTSPVSETVDRLARLVEASLVSFTDADASPRYDILETVRQHGAAGLSPDEKEAASLAHAEHVEAVVIEALDPMSNDNESVLSSGDLELGNVRAAMRWAYANDRPHLGLSIIRNARGYFWSKMMNREILDGLTAGIEAINDDSEAVLDASAVAVVEAFNVGNHAAGRRAAKRIDDALAGVDDRALRSTLLVALGTNVIETDPRRADRYYCEAGELGPLRPLRMLSILNNRVEVSWTTGFLDSGEMILEQLVEVAEQLTSAAPMATKIRAGVAARAARWDEVVAIAEAPTSLDPANEAAVKITYAEALAALGGFDEALSVLDPLKLVAHGHYLRNADLVYASINLGRGDPAAVSKRLSPVVDMIGSDERRLAIAMPVASLLAAAFAQSGEHDRAALLFGFAAAESRRLGVMLRPADRPLVEQATATCRRSLGGDEFERLSAEGALLAWRHLPTSNPAS